MSKVTGDFGNLIQGVSNQPDSRKFVGQSNQQVNMRSDLTKGLGRRPGFVRVGTLEGASDNIKWDISAGGSQEDVLIGLAEDTINIYNLDAEKKPFSFKDDSAEGYYTGGGTEGTLRGKYVTKSILDTTFLINKKITPKVYGGEEPERISRLTVWIEFKTQAPGNFIKIVASELKTYEVQVFEGYVAIDPNTGVPNTEDKEHTKEYSGSYHATAYAALNGEDASCTVKAYNNWVMIEAPDNLLSDTFEVNIVEGGESINTFVNTKIASIEELPPYATSLQGAKVEEGKGTDTNTGYFRASPLLDKDGAYDLVPVSWEECSLTEFVDDPCGFVGSTMPHRLVKDAAGLHSLEAIPWAERQVGDSDTNPVPSFIREGKPLTAIGLFQNRLFTSAGEYTMFSATDSYYDLWLESSFYLTDADPFQVVVDTDKVNSIKYAQSFNGDLLFFSDHAQFVMSGDNNHTYETAYMSAVSQYSCDLSVDPVMAGDRVMFATTYGHFAGIQEFFVKDQAGGHSAQSVTSHVSNYMNGSFITLSSSTNINVLVGLLKQKEEGGRNTAYFYEFFVDGGKKVQQSWSNWELPLGFEFQWLGFVDSTLYAVVSVPLAEGEKGYELWRMDWDDPPKGKGGLSPIRLDGLSLANRIMEEEGSVTYSVPWESSEVIFIVNPENSEEGGVRLDAVYLGDSSYLIKGEEGELSPLCGLPYESRYTFANPLVRDSEGASLEIDRLQLGRMYLRFTEVGEVTFTIEDERGRGRVLKYNNRRVNAPNNIPSYPPSEGSEWAFGIRKEAKTVSLTLSSSSHITFTVRSAEWSGEFVYKGKRV